MRVRVRVHMLMQACVGDVDEIGQEHPFQSQSDCVDPLRPFQKYTSAPNTVGWMEEEC